MRIILLCLMAFLFAITVNAQEAKQEGTQGELYYYQDHVKLRNGSLLIGKIIEDRPDESLIIRIRDGKEIKVNYYDILRIKRKRRKDPKNYKPLKNGYYSVLHGGFLSGRDIEGFVTASATIHTINGYRFHRLLSTGIGVGLDRYIADEINFYPVYLDLRGFMTKKRNSPYYVANVGYGIIQAQNPIDIEGQGGLFTHGAIGVRFASTKKAAFIMEFGWTRQKAELKRNSEIEGFEDTLFINYSRFSMKFGVMF